jgi:CHAD domain-containing protein/CYTH domain-containing protein
VARLKVPADFLDLPVEHATRVAAVALLRNGVTAHERLIDPTDGEALHDFRVAVRRLRSWLRAYRSVLKDGFSDKSRRQLKSIAAVTGSARDLEVHLEWLHQHIDTLDADRRSGAMQFRARLENEKQYADHALRSEVARDFTNVADKLRKSLAEYVIRVRIDDDPRPRPMAIAMAETLRGAAQALRDRLGAVTPAVDQPEAAHRVRIETKRLRYLLEPIAPDIERANLLLDRLVELQDLLGEMHDHRVLLREVLAESESSSLTEDDRAGLAALATTLREREAAAFATFEQHWINTGAQELFETVHAVAADLVARAYRDEEIERKYLLRGMPPHARRWPAKDIEQGYLPGERLVERLRRVQIDGTTKWYRTVKVGAGIARGEFEDETTASVFDVMWPLTEGHRVHKRRYTVPDGEHVWEVDEFIGRDLVLAEVELAAPDAPVDPPAWLSPYIVREVTGEAEYTNLHLAV